MGPPLQACFVQELYLLETVVSISKGYTIHNQVIHVTHCFSHSLSLSVEYQSHFGVLSAASRSLSQQCSLLWPLSTSSECILAVHVSLDVSRSLGITDQVCVCCKACLCELDPTKWRNRLER